VTGTAPANDVTVNLASLDSLIAELEGFGGELRAQVEGLEQQITGLHAQWSGSAAQAHSAFGATVAANRALFS
jgi:uncharacterized protein YukE